LNGAASAQSIVILISGRGSNMLALIERARRAGSPYSVGAVFSDRADAPGLTAARESGVAATALPAGKNIEREAYDGELAAAIREHNPALIVLAGFMRILSGGFVDAFAGKILNIHPSLLPKYPGLHTHRRALEAKDAEHGATVHFVTAQLDAGPAIIQGRVRVQPDDTEATLAARVQAQEHRIYPVAVEWFCEGRLRCADGQAWLDGRVLREPLQYADVQPAGLQQASS
jgi:phosphoribosylglycinamide formyltransferase-1